MTEENPIIEEIRRTREHLLAKHNGDLDSLITELQSLSVARGSQSQPGVILPKRPLPQESAKKVG